MASIDRSVSGFSRCGLEPEVQETRVHGVVVVLFFLDADELGVLDLHRPVVGVGDHVREVEHAEALGELVEDAVLTLLGGVEAGELDARLGVTEVERPRGSGRPCRRR